MYNIIHFEILLASFFDLTPFTQPKRLYGCSYANENMPFVAMTRDTQHCGYVLFGFMLIPCLCAIARVSRQLITGNSTEVLI